MYKCISLLFLFFIFSTPAYSKANLKPATTAEVVKNIPDLQSVSCKFTQERTFSTSSVKSSGDFKFIKGKGVYFLTTYPVKSSSSYTSANNKYINDIILAVSKKNFSKLDKSFDMHFNSAGNSWNIQLKPKDLQLKNHIDSIYICGDNKHITNVRLNQLEPSVQTNIKFHFGD